MEEMAGVNPPTFPAKDSVKDAAPVLAAVASV
jgi:glyceraldehyde 3-phosphate dehydrogenase